MKLDLLTNATVVDDAIRFVSQKSKEKIKSYLSSLSFSCVTQLSKTVLRVYCF